MELLDILESVLERCENFGVKLHPNSFFFSLETAWWGKKITGNGLSHYADRIQE